MRHDPATHRWELVKQDEIDAVEALKIAKRARKEVDYSEQLRWGLTAIRRAAEQGYNDVRDPVTHQHAKGDVRAAYHAELRRRGFKVEEFPHDPTRGNYYDSLPYTLISWYPDREPPQT